MSECSRAQAEQAVAALTNLLWRALSSDDHRIIAPAQAATEAVALAMRYIMAETADNELRRACQLAVEPQRGATDDPEDALTDCVREVAPIGRPE